MKNNDSILVQSQKARYKTIVVVLIFLMALGGGAYFLFGKKTAKNQEIEVVYDTVKIGNIENFIEESGKIVNSNVVNLSFLTNGTLLEMNVKEGDKVQKGKILAKLDRQELLLDLQDAQNNLEIVQANIKTKESQIIDSDLITAENDLETQKSSMDGSIEDLEQSLVQAVESGVLTLDTTLSDLKTNSGSLDEVLGVDQGYSKYREVPSSFNNYIGVNDARNNHGRIRLKLNELNEKYAKLDNSKIEDVLVLLEETKQLASDMQANNELVLGMFENTVPTKDISETLISETESFVKSNLAKAQTLVSGINTAKQKIDNASLAKKNNLTTLQNNLSSKELKLDITKSSVEQKQIEKDNSLNSLNNQLRQAQVKIDRVRYNLSLTSLVAPVNGEVVQVNGSAGESVKADSSGGENALVKILSDANFTTEVYVQESDIAKIYKDQTAKITMDAFEDAELDGVVTYISSIATIDNNNITTYLVRVEITDTKGFAVKEGMTTYVNFVTNSAQNVLVIPSKAVKNGRVQLADGTSKRVETGVTDGVNTEIKSGLTDGQKIIVSGGTTTEKGNGARFEQEMTEERAKMLKESGFTNEELKKLEAGEFTEEMRTKMQKFRETQTSKNGERRPPNVGGMGGSGMMRMAR